MSEREKLIDILANSRAVTDMETFEENADHLLKNGVTVSLCNIKNKNVKGV